LLPGFAAPINVFVSFDLIACAFELPDIRRFRKRVDTIAL
jgi:hypothetical protein